MSAKIVNKTKDLFAVFCEEGQRYKALRCDVGGRTCNCSTKSIKVSIKGVLSFPEGGQDIALQAFGFHAFDVDKP